MKTMNPLLAKAKAKKLLLSNSALIATSRREIQA